MVLKELSLAQNQLRQSLRSALNRKEKTRFRVNYAIFAEERLKNFKTKYLVSFPFDGETSLLLIGNNREFEVLDSVLAELETNQVISLKLGGVIDAGAHIGIHSIYFSKFFTNVFSFEPHPYIFKCLELNIMFQNLNEKVQCHNLGLSDQVRKLTLQDWKTGNMGGSTFQDLSSQDSQKRLHGEKFSSNFICELRQLDSMPDFENQVISLIKVDVEGHEYELLQGAKKLLARDHPVILLEDWNSRFGRESRSIQFLRSLGYKEFLIPSSHNLPEPKLRSRFLTKILSSSHGDKLKVCDFKSENGYPLIVCYVPKSG